MDDVSSKSFKYRMLHLLYCQNFMHSAQDSYSLLRAALATPLDEMSLICHRILRINVPSGTSCPTKVAFGQGSSQLVIATEDISGKV